MATSRVHTPPRLSSMPDLIPAAGQWRRWAPFLLFIIVMRLSLALSSIYIPGHKKDVDTLGLTQERVEQFVPMHDGQHVARTEWRHHSSPFAASLRGHFARSHGEARNAGQKQGELQKRRSHPVLSPNSTTQTACTALRFVSSYWHNHSFCFRHFCLHTQTERRTAIAIQNSAQRQHQLGQDGLRSPKRRRAEMS